MSRFHWSVVGFLVVALASAAYPQTAVLPGRRSTSSGASRASLAPASSTWQTRIGEDLRQQEYHFQQVPGEEGVWSAPNRSHELRCRVSCEGLTIFPRRTSADGRGGDWNVTLRTQGIGRAGGACALDPLSISVEGNRIDLDRGPLGEWLENRERGIEQSWLIAVRPDDDGPLLMDVEISGLTPCIDKDGRSAVLTDAEGTVRLLYRDLHVFDACGRALDARMQPISGGICIRIEDEGASYPVTVDPWLGGPDWTAEGDQGDALFGWSVSGAGDVNGDGFDDVIVGARWFDNGQVDEGRAYLYLGSAGGPALAADWTAESNQAGAEFGIDVSRAGDVNGDGFDDVLVGASGFDNGQVDEGRAYLYLGSASGPLLVPNWTAESDQDDASFGNSVSAAGDVNGDGFDDMIIGAWEFDNGQVGEGRAYIFLGSASGPSLNPDWTAESNQSGAYLGGSVAGAGDVDADGFDDVIVGAWGFNQAQYDEGRAFLYLGSVHGPSLAPDWTAESDQVEAYFGYSVSGAGDVNRDGFDDVIVGAYLFNHGEHDEGRAFLYLGSAGGLSLAPDWTAESDQIRAYFGVSVSGAGDVDGDGFDDVIVGANGFDNGEHDEGGAFLYRGSAGGLSPAPDWTAESDQFNAFFALSVAGAGDVNGDGLGDMIVGAPDFDNDQTDEGRTFLYLPCGPIGTGYCSSTANSTGAPAALSAWCPSSSAVGSLTLDAAPVPDQFGIFFHGRTQTQTPFGNGYLCVMDDLARGTPIHAGDHVASYRYDNSDTAHSLAAYVGTTRNFQYWFRDPVAGGAFFNTSNGVSIVVSP